MTTTPTLRHAHVHSIGLEGLVPRVERIVATPSNLPDAKFVVVGMPETSARETRIRVRAALAHLGYLTAHLGYLTDIPLTISVDPVDGCAHLDLGIALATLVSMGVLGETSLRAAVVLGELGLDGTIRPVRGVLPRLDLRGYSVAIVPHGNRGEAAAAAATMQGIEVYTARNLKEIVKYLRGAGSLNVARPDPVVPRGDDENLIRDLAHTSKPLRRVIEIAAAGMHNVLLAGPVGSGKTRLARLLSRIMPPLDVTDATLVTEIHSVAGILSEGQGLLRDRPFRAPHHTVSEAGLLGGKRPGEISLAHKGVLFLDEMTEFRQSTLDALRTPLKHGYTRHVSRINYPANPLHVSAVTHYPAKPLLVGAVTRCPCGYLGCIGRRCVCTTKQVQDHVIAVGKVADLFEIQCKVDLELPSPTDDDFADAAAIKARVARAAAILEELPAPPLAHHLKVARTIAALDGRVSVSEADVVEACALCEAQL